MRLLLATVALMTIAACANENPLSVCQSWSTEGSWDCRYRDLSGADLSGADLTRANLTRADLSGADLSGADLSGAYLSGVYLSGVDLSGAVADENTIWSIWLGGEQGFDLEANRLAAAQARRAGVIFR